MYIYAVPHAACESTRLSNMYIICWNTAHTTWKPTVRILKTSCKTNGTSSCNTHVYSSICNNNDNDNANALQLTIIYVHTFQQAKYACSYNNQLRWSYYSLNMVMYNTRQPCHNRHICSYIMATDITIMSALSENKCMHHRYSLKQCKQSAQAQVINYALYECALPDRQWQQSC